MATESMSTHDLAVVVVTAMDFCLGFRKAGDGVTGVPLATAMENPSSLSPNAAEEMYFSLEEILLTGQQQNPLRVAQTRERLGTTSAAHVAQQLSIMEMALRVLMTRAAQVFDRSVDERARQLGRRLSPALTKIDEAVAFEKKMRASFGEMAGMDPLTGEDWEFLRKSAYLAAKSELMRRDDVRRNWRNVGIAVIVGLLGVAFKYIPDPSKATISFSVGPLIRVSSV